MTRVILPVPKDPISSGSFALTSHSHSCISTANYYKYMIEKCGECHYFNPSDYLHPENGGKCRLKTNINITYPNWTPFNALDLNLLEIEALILLADPEQTCFRKSLILTMDLHESNLMIHPEELTDFHTSCTQEFLQDLPDLVSVNLPTCFSHN